MQNTNTQSRPLVEQVKDLFKQLSHDEQHSMLNFLESEYKKPKTSRKRKVFDEKLKEETIEKFKSTGSATRAAEYINDTYPEVKIDESYVRRWAEASLSSEEIK